MRIIHILLTIIYTIQSYSNIKTFIGYNHILNIPYMSNSSNTSNSSNNSYILYIISPNKDNLHLMNTTFHTYNKTNNFNITIDLYYNPSKILNSTEENRWITVIIMSTNQNKQILNMRFDLNEINRKSIYTNLNTIHYDNDLGEGNKLKKKKTEYCEKNSKSSSVYILEYVFQSINEHLLYDKVNINNIEKLVFYIPEIVYSSYKGRIGENDEYIMIYNDEILNDSSNINTESINNYITNDKNDENNRLVLIQSSSKILKNEKEEVNLSERLMIIVLLTIITIGIFVIMIRFSLKSSENIRSDIEKMRFHFGSQVLLKMSIKNESIRSLVQKVS